MIYSDLNNLEINTNELLIDHLGFQVDSADEYDLSSKELNLQANKISENIVGGRRVGIFRLHKDLIYKNEPIAIVEIFEPRKGQAVSSGWEHVEFLLKDGKIEDLVEKYPNLNWDKSAISREEFPMLILQLASGLRAKFPRLSVIEEVKRVN